MAYCEHDSPKPTNRSAEDKLYRQQIARIFQTVPSKVLRPDLSLLHRLNEGDFSSALDDHLSTLLLEWNGWTKPSKKDHLALTYATEGLLDTEPPTISFGIAGDFYRQALLGYQATHSRAQDHNALLAGAHTSVSMREFATTVQRVYPAAECLVVDPNPSDKADTKLPHCGYLKTDVCDLPALHQRFDSIHTSGLLDFLGSTERRFGDAPELIAYRERFFNSIAQIIQPDGILVMVERPITPYLRYSEQPYIGELEKAGFKVRSIALPRTFINRRYLDRYMRNKSKVIPEKYLRTNNGLMGIIATK